MSDKTASFFRFLAYTIEVILVFVLGSTPRLLPELFGSKPCLLMCVALTVALFEREIASMVFGLICGLLIDLGYSDSVGVFTVCLTLICFVIGYAANNLIRANFLNFMICSALVIPAVFMLYFLVTIVWQGIEEPWEFFKNHLISRIFQTFLFSVVFYFINKFIYESLSQEPG